MKKMKIKNIAKELLLGSLLSTIPLIANSQEAKIEKPREEKNIIVSVNAGYFYPKDLVNRVYGGGGNFSLDIGYKKGISLFNTGLNYFETRGNFRSSYDTEFLFSKRRSATSSKINMKSVEPGFYINPSIDQKNEISLGGGPLAGVLEEVLSFFDKGVFSGEEQIDHNNKIYFGWHAGLDLKHKIGSSTYLKLKTRFKDAKVNDFDFKLGGYEVSGGVEARF